MKNCNFLFHMKTRVFLKCFVRGCSFMSLWFLIFSIVFPKSLLFMSLRKTLLFVTLRILTEKNYPKINFQRLQKVWIWTFRSLEHQNNSLYEILKLKKFFQTNKVITGKNPFFVIGLFCTHYSICFSIGF